MSLKVKGNVGIPLIIYTFKVCCFIWMFSGNDNLKKIQKSYDVLDFPTNSDPAKLYCSLQSREYFNFCTELSFFNSDLFSEIQSFEAPNRKTYSISEQHIFIVN
jgi:hypothetical protein